jgi:hypothetical protein
MVLVNLDFSKFNQVQKKHQTAYPSNATLDNSGSMNKSDENTQENTDKSVGSTGRNGLQ